MSGQDSVVSPRQDTLEPPPDPLHGPEGVTEGDSLFPLYFQPASGPAPEDSVFRTSQLAEGTGNSPAPDTTGSGPAGTPAWFFFFLFGLLTFIAWIRMNYGNILLHTIQAAADYRVATRMFRDNSLLQKQLDNMLYVLYFLALSFFLYFLEQRYSLTPYGLQGGLLLLFNLLMLAGIFFARLLLVNLTGLIFDRVSYLKEYAYHIFIFNKLTGIAAVPLLLFLVYTSGMFRELFLWVSAGLLSAVILLRLARGWVFYRKKDVSLLYMFLYLCALEIVPLAFLYRWLESIL